MNDAPIAYLERTRSYYQALGYGEPYQWAQQAQVPFQRLGKPMGQCRVALVTTAAPYQSDKGDQGPGAPYNAAAKFYTVYSGDTRRAHDLRISHVAIDRKHTSAKDQASYFPLTELHRQAGLGRIGAVARRFHGAPTNRSQRTTLQVDGPEIVRRCRADGADCVILVANCPVCHQSLCLVACMLESAGIPAVLLGCAHDIVEHVGTPRFVFSDFPLGNAAGRPRDPVSQALTMELALQLLETATAARSTLRSPLLWGDDSDWKLDYCNVERLSADEIARRRAAFDVGREQARELRGNGTDRQSGVQ